MNKFFSLDFEINPGEQKGYELKKIWWQCLVLLLINCVEKSALFLLMIVTLIAGQNVLYWHSSWPV